MTESDKEALARFRETHGITIPSALRDDVCGLLAVMHARVAINDQLSALCSHDAPPPDATWAMTRSMLERVYEQIEGVYVSFFAGVWACLEVVCRATMEAAVNVKYVLEKDTDARLSQYFSQYFDETVKTISRYEAVDNDSRRNAQKARIDMASRKDLLEQVLRNEGLPIGQKGWPPTIAARYLAVGKEKQYREIYATLSSQTHNDADALIDFIVFTALKNFVPGSEQIMGAEILHWQRHYMYRTSLDYVEVATCYADRYRLNGAQLALREATESLQTRLQHINDEFLAMKEDA